MTVSEGTGQREEGVGRVPALETEPRKGAGARRPCVSEERQRPPSPRPIAMLAVPELHRPSGTFRPLTAVFPFACIADVYFIATLSFLWKVSVITLVSCLPLYVLKYLRRRFSPPSYSKLTS